MVLQRQSSLSLEELVKQILARNYGNLNQAGYNNPIGTQKATDNPAFAAGRAAGKFLQEGIGNLINNYNERGRLKADKQEELSEMFKKQYGDNAPAVIEDLKKQGIWDNWNKLNQFNPESYSPSGSATIPQQAMTAATYPNQKQVAIDKAVPGQDLQQLLSGNGSALANTAKVIEDRAYDKPFGDEYSILQQLLGRR